MSSFLLSCHFSHPLLPPTSPLPPPRHVNLSGPRVVTRCQVVLPAWSSSSHLPLPSLSSSSSSSSSLPSEHVATLLWQLNVTVASLCCPHLSHWPRNVAFLQSSSCCPTKPIPPLSPLIPPSFLMPPILCFPLFHPFSCFSFFLFASKPFLWNSVNSFSQCLSHFIPIPSSILSSLFSLCSYFSFWSNSFSSFISPALYSTIGVAFLLIFFVLLLPSILFTSSCFFCRSPLLPPHL